MGVFVVWENEKGQLEILDGQQRIRTIIQYIEGRFKDNNGRAFYELNAEQQRGILSYTLYCLKLLSTLSEEETSDIFTNFRKELL